MVGSTSSLCTPCRWRLLRCDGELLNSISSRGAEEDRNFASTREEADIKMLLHAVSANVDFGSHEDPGTIIIRSPDTDILVVAVHYFSKMANSVTMWTETGTTDKRRCVRVYSICAALGSQF